MISILGGYIGYEIYATLQRFNDSTNSVSWAAHMGGAMTGLLCGVVLLRNVQKTVSERISKLFRLKHDSNLKLQTVFIF